MSRDLGAWNSDVYGGAPWPREPERVPQLARPLCPISSAHQDCLGVGSQRTSESPQCFAVSRGGTVYRADHHIGCTRVPVAA